MDLSEFRRLTDHLDGSREVLLALDEFGNKVVRLGDVTPETMEEDRHGNIDLLDDQGGEDDSDEDGRPLGTKQSRCVVFWPSDE